MIHPLRQSETQFPWSQGGRTVHVQVIQLGAALTANLQHVFKSEGGDQRGSTTFTFQQGIGCDGRAMDEIGAGFPISVDKTRTGLANSLHDAHRRIAGGRRQFVDLQPAIFQYGYVGESAAHIDSDDGFSHRLGKSPSVNPVYSSAP